MFKIFSTYICWINKKMQHLEVSGAVRPLKWSLSVKWLRKKLLKCCMWSIALYGAETWTLQKVDQKYPGISEIRCWTKLEKIGWTDHVRNEEVLWSVKEKRNALQSIKGRKANWIGHSLHRNYLLKHVIEVKIEGRIEVKTDEEEDVSSYWITLRRREYTGTRKRQH